MPYNVQYYQILAFDSTELASDLIPWMKNPYVYVHTIVME